MATHNLWMKTASRVRARTKHPTMHPEPGAGLVLACGDSQVYVAARREMKMQIPIHTCMLASSTETSMPADG